jgi:hypothetical protein
MTKNPGAAPQPGPDAPKDPAKVLVDALGALPEADRDLVYTWLLRRGFGTGAAAGLTGPGRASGVALAALLQQNVRTSSGAPLAQAAGQQMVPVRFSSEQHTQLRQWCSEHGFSMATVIRGLVSRFLEGQLPGPGPPA